MQLSKKKLKRIEKKKKKLAALIEIAELNNKDRTELQLPSLCGPDGDKSRMTDCQDTSAVENKPTLMQVDELSSYDGRGDSVMNSGSVSEDAEHTHKKKKKKKSKHHEEKEKRRSKTVDKGREEWPSLLKRKSSIELEIQKERPVKILKRQSGEHDQHERPGSTSTPSYAEELAMFKVDLNRSKHKKEKKRRKDKVMETAEETTDGATPNSDSDKKIKKRKEQTDQTEETTTEDQIQESDLDEKISLAKSEQSFDELKQLLRARKKQLKEIPNVRLKKTGKEADLECLSQRVPILPGDVQTFLLFSQLGSNSPRFPRWVELKKGDRISKTVLLVVDGLSAYDFLNQESSCPALHNMDVKAEMVTPFCYGSTLVEELCAVPLSRQQTKDLEKRFGKEICPEALLTDRVIKVLRSAFSISSVPKTQCEAVEKKISVPTGDKFPRTELLLSAWQLIEEGYPLPYGCQELGDRYPDYVMTKDEYTEVTPSSPLWAVDCEMCLTRAGNELTRVSVVNEQHQTVYESFCVPRNPIINYLTEFSGITPEMLKGVETRLEDIQRDLRELFPSDVILVGQSLNGDLHALKMMHPYVIDTSVIFNLTGNRKHKSKLSRLAQEFLNETIQQHGAAGHDSVEDSLAALKLVQYKLTKSVEFGDAVLSGLKEDAGNAYSVVHKEHKVEEFDDLKVEVGPTMATSLFKHITMHKRTVCVIGPEETLAEYSAFIAAARTENKEMIRTVSTESNVDTITRVSRECADAHFILAHTTLSDEEDITHVNSWMEDLYNAPPFNALFIVVLAGSHNNNANGAALIKVKKPNLRLKKTRRAD